MAGDPLWYYKVLGLHCDGTNGSTTITDVKGHTATLNGGVQISTAQYPALTGKTSSLSFDGTGDYVTFANSSDWEFGSGDFIVRLRCRPASATFDLLIHRGTSVGVTAWAIAWDGTTGAFYVDWSTDGASSSYLYSSSTYSPSTWHLVEFIRSGTTMYLGVDAIVEATATGVSGALMSESGTLKLGTDQSNTYQYTGYMSEIEIYKGAAEHTANYTISGIPFPDEYVYISGTTKDASNTPVSRLVRVYRRDTGALVSSVLSNGTTGVYKVTAENSGTSTPLQHFVVEFDTTTDPPGSPTENAQIYDNVTPA